MKLNTLLIKTFALIVCSMLVFNSCKKEEKEKEEDKDTTSASDNTLAEAVYEDVQAIADEAASNKSLSMYKISPDYSIMGTCATLSFDTINHSDKDTITIDFGSVNCLCKDGRFRRGKIIVTYTGKYRETGAVITITFNSYFVNDNWVQGSRTITNKGKNTAGNYVHSVVVNGVIILADNSGTILWTAKKEREWLSGYETFYLSDDTYSVTGTMEGQRKSGKSFTAKITTALIRKMSFDCRKHFVSGTFELTPEDKTTRTVDYGNGTCDNLATVTIKGKIYTIVLK